MMLSTLYLLAKNPDKQEILRKEIYEKVPERNSPLNSENMKNMPYLRATIKEAMRMKPVVAGTLRRVASNIVLGGYQVPKGYYVVIPSVLMSVDEKNFKRPDEFIPERFLKKGPCPELESQQPFAFLPLGFGSRMCIGKRIANLELEVLLAR